MAILHALLPLVAACIGFALLARWLHLPYAAVLVVGGMLLAFIPGLPTVELDPELVLAFFLPPLLQASAYRTDWRGFRANLRPILLLAVGCVLFTALCIGAATRLLLPDLPWAAAIALGAIIAAPDAPAAAAVLGRLTIPRRITTVLLGESLINDATALVLYRFALVALAVGSVSPGQALLAFLTVALGGIALGYAVARAAAWALARIEDTVLETTLSFLAAYVSFLLGEAVGVSGVTSVVTTGLVLGQQQYRILSARTRVEAQAVWAFVEFLLTSLVFVLAGLQLNTILDRLAGRGVLELAGLALAISAVLIVSRFVWVFPATWIPRLIPAVRRADPMPPLSHVTVIAWSGMRGVVGLAVALGLPLDFPERDLAIFLAFCAILATLVVQGTTLEWLIRRLGVTLPAHRNGVDPAEAEGRRVASQAALAEIERLLEDPLEGAIAADIVNEYRDRAGHLHRMASGDGAAAAERAARRRIRLAALAAARQRLLDHHGEGGLHDEALVKLNQELDLEELRLRQVLGDERTEAERAEAARRRRGQPLLALPPHG